MLSGNRLHRLVIDYSGLLILAFSSLSSTRKTLLSFYKSLYSSSHALISNPSTKITTKHTLNTSIYSNNPLIRHSPFIYFHHWRPWNLEEEDLEIHSPPHLIGFPRVISNIFPPSFFKNFKFLLGFIVPSKP